jgi:hypothetical protein
VAQVGQELTIQLDGTDKSGGRLSYSYKAPDLKDLAGNAEITVAPSGAGVFRWTPLAADIGAHSFDFTASNGSADTTVTITITVKSAIGSSTAPVFRQPLGTGTTIDLTHQTCVDLDVVIEDQDTPQVKIAQEDPVIDGATLTPKDGQSAHWHWCPSTAQQTESRYTLVLSADDGDNPKVLKNYLIVLRGTTGSTCPGVGPSISNTPQNPTTRLDLPVTASVTDATGLKDTPLFYYSSSDPGPTPDLSTMTQLSATLASGDNKNGTWTATVPNPVASMSDGASATIYYVFVAEDHDDTNNCDHVTQTQTYQMTVTAGGSSNAGLCGACTSDSQCGTGNECVYVGNLGDSYCMQACGGGCPSGYTCSSSPIWSVDFNQAVQCIPQSGSCTAPTGLCDNNDGWHPNQTQSNASANPVMAPGYYDNLVSCPNPTSTTRAEDDWYKIQLTSSANVDIYLSGDGAVDLDLHLYHSDGTYVDSSTSSTPNEEVHDCLGAYTYYIKVNGYGYARSVFSLDVVSTATASCP